MNLNNLKRCQLFGSKLVTTGGHVAVHTPLRAYGFSRPVSVEESDQFTPETATNPDPAQREFVEADPANLPASRAILSLTALDHATAKLNADQRLTATGRAEQLAAPRVNCIKTIAKSGSDLVAVGQTVRKTASEFYAPRKLAVNDAVAAHEDVELRSHWRDAPPPKRSQMLRDIQSGKNDRMLEALTRSPISLEPHEASIVQGAWIDRVAARDPARHAAVQASLDSHLWATSIVKDAATYSRKATGLSPVEIAQAAQACDGAGLFSNANSIPLDVPGQVAASA
jgi:hypothetical protein